MSFKTFKSKPSHSNHRLQFASIESKYDDMNMTALKKFIRENNLQQEIIKLSKRSYSTFLVRNNGDLLKLRKYVKQAMQEKKTGHKQKKTKEVSYSDSDDSDSDDDSQQLAQERKKQNLSEKRERIKMREQKRREQDEERTRKREQDKRKRQEDKRRREEQIKDEKARTEIEKAFSVSMLNLLSNEHRALIGVIKSNPDTYISDMSVENAGRFSAKVNHDAPAFNILKEMSKLIRDCVENGPRFLKDYIKKMKLFAGPGQTCVSTNVWDFYCGERRELNQDYVKKFIRDVEAVILRLGGDIELVTADEGRKMALEMEKMSLDVVLLSEENEDLKSDIEQLTVENEELKSDMDDLKVKIRNCQDIEEQAENIQEKLSKELRETKEENIDIGEKNESLQTKLKNLEQKLDKLMDENEKLQRKISEK